MRGDALNGSRAEDSIRTVPLHPPVLSALDGTSFMGGSDELLPPFLASRSFRQALAGRTEVEPSPETSPEDPADSAVALEALHEEQLDASAALASSDEADLADHPFDLADETFGLDDGSYGASDETYGLVDDAPDLVDDAQDRVDDAYFGREYPEDMENALPASERVAPTPPPAKVPVRDSAVREVAARLERLAARLRKEGLDAVPGAVGEGDRFDALLIGIVAGFLAADRD